MVWIQCALRRFSFLSFVIALLFHSSFLHSEEPIKVGVLHSLSGTMAISETPVVDAVILAIKQINDRGGLLGRKLEAIIVDGGSNGEKFKQKAESLIHDEKVDVVFGCWTSACRKTVKPIFENSGVLLFYSVQYEGMEESSNIIYAGATPNQQLTPVLKWLAEQDKKRIYLLGSDYIFPQMFNLVAHQYVKEYGMTIVGEKYVPLGSRNFDVVINDIKNTSPDVILNSLNGSSNITFFNALHESGFNATELPVVSFSLGESDIKEMPTSEIVGHYVSSSYFDSLNTKQNRSFKKELKSKLSINEASAVMASSYASVLVWAQAVTRAGNTLIDHVVPNLAGTYQTPAGKMKYHPNNNHFSQESYIGKVDDTGIIDIVWRSEQPIKPEVFPNGKGKGYWYKKQDDLYEEWGKRWSYSDERSYSYLSVLNTYTSEDEPYIIVDTELKNSNSGFMGDYIREAFLNNGFELNIQKVPKARDKRTIKTDSSFWFPAVRCEGLYPSKPLWHSVAGLAVKKSNLDNEIEHIGMVRGNEINDSVTSLFKGKNLKYSFATNNQQNVKKLFHERVDAVVIDEYQLSYILSSSMAARFDIVFLDNYQTNYELRACFSTALERSLFEAMIDKFKTRKTMVLPTPRWR
ncbi:transporter substrate-binding protein [Vibrio sp. Of7-15]|uniref:urea ABC transporter substrate-binding protein n=1 Tax=Vibrio sp. Of7-15 TaxID=2724879 RepID=UPI001EF16476|nr:urea ABC transporter substrate-binding protein [Vibrio sp. Of7-15]MCG7495510.1 transporter substrate-binding protein [Vibrio sp. Of7-15]